MAVSHVSGEHIEITPGIAGGRPRIAGHRVRVQDIVLWHDALGLSPEEIIARCPGLGLADVYAALAYYHDHTDEIQTQIKQDNALAETLRNRIPSKLLAKLGGNGGGDDPISSR